MRNFDLVLGIDYSGAQTPASRLKGLQMYAAQRGGVPQKRFSQNKLQDMGTLRHISAKVCA